MTDVLTPEQRHRAMSHIHSKNTRPELIVRKYLFSHGFRYRLNVKTLPGSPDIVLRKYRTVIFVNGCFWHGHEGCNYSRLPQTRTEWWQNKIMRNKKRDLKALEELKNMGWHTIVIWECQLKPKTMQHTLQGLEYILNSFLLEELKTRYALPEETGLLTAAEPFSIYTHDK